MRLLVTRPEADGQALAAKLEARGHHVICAPVIDIVMRDVAPDLSGIKALAFTSANGARAIRPFFDAARHVPAYAVGPQTAAALTAIGFADVHCAAGDVASLAQSIAKGCPHGPVLHISGRDQAGDLAAQLSAAGCAARRAVLYEARAARELPAAALTPLRAHRLDGVILYSKRSAEIFYRLAETAQISVSVVRAFCLSEAVADIARAAGARTSVAGFPDDAHILACLDAAEDR
jgi:uroporphyrinogen-III synthase